jgi:hypothetical protein
MKPMVGLIVFLCIVLNAKAAEIIARGDDVPIGKGTARSFVKTDEQGTPLVLGFWLTAKALEGLSAQDEVYNIPLPANITVAPYDHLTLNWNAHGHIPDGIYNVSHFDFHFFLIPPLKVAKITCTGADTAPCMKQPDADKIPPNYVGAPEGTAKMGWHWVDVTSPEFHGEPFTATFVYGYYNGELTFIEPMAALSYFTSSVSFENDVPLPKKLNIKGYYPTKYSITYEAPMDSYWVSLKNLTWRE